MAICALEVRASRQNYCPRHKCFHEGQDLVLALADTKEGATFRHKLDRALKVKRVWLSHTISPGDSMVLTAAIESVGYYSPLTYTFKVQCSSREVFVNNPHCSDFPRDQADLVIEAHYPDFAERNWRDVRYLQGYTHFLGEKLGLKLKCAVPSPRLYFSPAELAAPRLIDEPYVVINSGYKKDGTLKNWGIQNWIEVSNWIQSQGLKVVQVGTTSPHHVHKPLPGAIDMRHNSPHRVLYKLALDSEYGLGAESYLHHIYAATPIRKPFVCVASGIFPTTAMQYGTERYLCRQGTMDCCRTRGCGGTGGPNTVVPGPGLVMCHYPDKVGDEPVAGCLARIKPAEVIEAIKQWYLPGGVLSPEAKKKLKPGLLQMARNYAAAKVKLARDGFRKCTDEEMIERLNICQACENFNPDVTCKVCGCQLLKKLTDRSAVCPAKPPKWEALP